jgi:hypothetical protein
MTQLSQEIDLVLSRYVARLNRLAIEQEELENTPGVLPRGWHGHRARECRENAAALEQARLTITASKEGGKS